MGGKPKAASDRAAQLFLALIGLLLRLVQLQAASKLEATPVEPSVVCKLASRAEESLAKNRAILDPGC